MFHAIALVRSPVRRPVLARLLLFIYPVSLPAQTAGFVQQSHATAVVERQSRGEHRTLHMVADYAANNILEKIFQIILSYTDFVNRKVWHKSILSLLPLERMQAPTVVAEQI